MRGKAKKFEELKFRCRPEIEFMVRNAFLENNINNMMLYFNENNNNKMYKELAKVKKEIS